MTAEEIRYKYREIKDRIKYIYRQFDEQLAQLDKEIFKLQKECPHLSKTIAIYPSKIEHCLDCGETF